MKEQIEQMIAELEKAIQECKRKSTEAPLAFNKGVWHGAAEAYQNVITTAKREFKNLLQPDVIGRSELLVCPFCNDNEFDEVGLKHHLENYCEVYGQTNSL